MTAVPTIPRRQMLGGQENSAPLDHLSGLVKGIGPFVQN